MDAHLWAIISCTDEHRGEEPKLLIAWIEKEATKRLLDNLDGLELHMQWEDWDERYKVSGENGPFCLHEWKTYKLREEIEPHDADELLDTTHSKILNLIGQQEI